MSAARTLAVSACFFTKSRAASGTSRFWSLVNASVTGAKASLTVFSTELVSVVIGVSPSSGFELWAHPVRFGPGRDRCAIVNCATQHQCCIAISRIRDQPDYWAEAACGTGSSAKPLVLDGSRKPVSLHLCPNLRH